MSALIKAREFHQMKGHIDEGNQILFSSGEVLIIKNSMRGWHLYAYNERTDISGPMDASGLTRFIWDREGK